MTPLQVRAARLAAGLTQAQAAELAGLGARERWVEYEAGTRHMPAARFQMFMTNVAERKTRGAPDTRGLPHP